MLRVALPVLLAEIQKPLREAERTGGEFAIVGERIEILSAYVKIAAQKKQCL